MTAVEQPTQERAESPPEGGGPQGGKPRRRLAAANPPRLADGVELAGRFEDSGYEDPPYIARREDGQVVQLPELLYFLLEEVDGERSREEIAERLSERISRRLSPEDVRMLLDERLLPLGLLALHDGTSPKLPKLDPLLALRFRIALLPERASQAVATVFAPLFFPPIVLAVVAAVVAVDVWIFGLHGVAQSARTLLYNPLWMLVLVGLLVVGTVFHEIGHASALRYGGGRPGAMGAGIYIVWPALYTDVTDAYRLGRGGRVRTDLGGVYFHAIFILGVFGAFLATGIEQLLVLVLLVHLQILQQFMPFLRLDGYYVVSDLTGVPDLFARIKPTLRSALPGSDDDQEAQELKPWVRRVTTTWVVLVVPVVLLVFGLILFNAPRMVATAWDSFWVQADKVEGALGAGDAPLAAVSGLQALFLMLPTAGLTYTFGRVGWRTSSSAWAWSSESWLRRTSVAAVLGGALAVGAYVLVPNGDYVPIQPGERGTVLGGIRQLSNVSSGRPALTEEREKDLGEIVRERDRVEGGTPFDGGVGSPGLTTDRESTFPGSSGDGTSGITTDGTTTVDTVTTGTSTTPTTATETTTPTTTPTTTTDATTTTQTTTSPTTTDTTTTTQTTTTETTTGTTP